jgi:hypothetical protein
MLQVRTVSFLVSSSFIVLYFPLVSLFLYLYLRFSTKKICPPPPPIITEKKKKARKNKSTDPDYQIEDENGVPRTCNNDDDDSNTSLITAPEDQQHNLEGSIRSFTVLTPITTRELGASVQVTGALADVRTKYHVNSNELGHGHYGVVRKCMDRNTNEWYAIKSIRKAKVKKIEVLKREISILKEVKHPHIIELVDVFEDSKYLHLVTELCIGGELFDRIIEKSQSIEGHYSERDAALIIRDILDAIAYCHSKGIVHRDLKPEVRLLYLFFCLYEAGRRFRSCEFVGSSLSLQVISPYHIINYVAVLLLSIV